MREFEDVIAKLGEMSAPHIAEHFREHQIRARPRTSSFCAVAQYVKQETGARWVSVSPHTVSAMNYAEVLAPPYVRPWQTVTPASVDEFIRQFDRGHYPDLEIR